MTDAEPQTIDDLLSPVTSATAVEPSQFVEHSGNEDSRRNDHAGKVVAEDRVGPSESRPSTPPSTSAPPIDDRKDEVVSGSSPRPAEADPERKKAVRPVDRRPRRATTRPKRTSKLLIVGLPAGSALAVFTVITTVWGPLAGTVTATLTLTLVVWGLLVGYSRCTWPYLGCKTCGGTGRDYEPRLLALLCFRLKCAWRDCAVCQGKARYDRRDRSRRRFKLAR